MLRFLLLLGVLLAVPQQAFACKFQPLEFGEQFAKTKTAFIGPVVTDEMGLVTLRAEKGLKGIDNGVTVDVEMGKSSCHLRMAPGQVWLFLGDTLPAGSRLLMDEYGRVVEENAKFVKEKFDYDVAQSPSVRGGVVEATCAPWDGAAFKLSLDNGVIVYVYAGLEDIAQGVRAYNIEPTEQKQGGGVILDACDAKKRNCKEHAGRVLLGFVGAETASGQVEIFSGEHKSTHVFRVKREAGNAICG